MNMKVNAYSNRAVEVSQLEIWLERPSNENNWSISWIVIDGPTGTNRFVPKSIEQRQIANMFYDPVADMLLDLLPETAQQQLSRKPEFNMEIEGVLFAGVRLVTQIDAKDCARAQIKFDEFSSDISFLRGRHVPPPHTALTRKNLELLTQTLDTNVLPALDLVNLDDPTNLSGPRQIDMTSARLETLLERRGELEFFCSFITRYFAFQETRLFDEKSLF